MQSMMDMMGANTFGWLWMFIPLLFWGGLLALVAWVVVKVFPGRRGEEPSASEDNVEEILRKRFARGEINAEEYEKSLEVLRRERNASRGGV